MSYLPQLKFAQWSKPGAPQPVLNGSFLAKTAGATSFNASVPLLDDENNPITVPLIAQMTKLSTGYMMSCYLPNGMDGPGGLSATGVVPAISLAGTSLETIPDLLEDFDDQDPIAVSIAPAYLNMLMEVFGGTRATGGFKFILGQEGTAAWEIVRMEEGVEKKFIEHNGTQIFFYEDGVTPIGLGDLVSSVLFKVSETDTTPGYSFYKSEAGDGITIERVSPGGDEKLKFSLDVGATPAEIAQALSGISPNVTAANLSEVMGGGKTNLHSHDSDNIMPLEVGEPLVAGDVVFVQGLEKVELNPDQDATIAEDFPDTNFGSAPTLGVNVNNSTNTVNHSLIHFDLDGLPASVTKALLRLKLSSDSNMFAKDRTIVAYPLTGDFVGSEVTWTGAPGYRVDMEGRMLYDIDNLYRSNDYAAIDITQIYNEDWSDANDGLRLRLSSEDKTNGYYLSFHSAEASVGNRPVLQLFYKGDNFGKVFKPTNAKQAACAVGILLVDASEGTAQVATGGIVSGFTDLEPFKPYKANTSGGIEPTEEIAEAQFIALSDTTIKILSKTRKYSSDVLGINRTTDYLDQVYVDVPGGVLIEGLEPNASTSSVDYDTEGLIISIPNDTVASAIVGSENYEINS